MKICGIYGLICPIDNELRYIGKTVDMKARLRTHKHAVKKKIKIGKRLNHKENWIKKILDNGLYGKLRYIMIETYDTDISNDFLYKREQIVIKKYKSDGYNLVNSCDGGQGLSPEELKKLWEDGIYDNSMAHNVVYMKIIGNDHIIKFDKTIDCVKSVDVSYSSIFRSIKYDMIIKEKYMFSSQKNINESEYKFQTTGAIITKEKYGINLYVINIITKKISKYDSISECAGDMNLDHHNIKNSMNNKTLYEVYIFVTNIPNDIDNIIEEYTRNTHNRIMNGTRIMKIMNKKFIKIIFKNGAKKEFDTIKELSEKMNIKQSTIRKYRNSGIYYKNRYLIISESDDPNNPNKLMKTIRIKPIKIIFKNETEKEFDTIKELSEKMNIMPKTIRKYRNSGIYYKNQYLIQY